MTDSDRWHIDQALVRLPNESEARTYLTHVSDAALILVPEPLKAVAAQLIKERNGKTDSKPLRSKSAE